MTRAMIRSIRPSLGGSNGRMTTRELFGLRMIPVRLTSMRAPRLRGERGRREPLAAAGSGSIVTSVTLHGSAPDSVSEEHAVG